MTFIKSDIDNEYYMVRDLPDKYQACNTIAIMKQKVNILIDHLYEKKDTDYKEFAENIYRLKQRVYDITISENNGRGKETSYSVNKGDELVLCLRSKSQWNKFHDNNLIFYVVLHELSHIASPTYEPEYNNHGPVFKKIFAFIVTIAINIGIYEKINFNEKSEEYCGIYITDSII